MKNRALILGISSMFLSACITDTFTIGNTAKGGALGALDGGAVGAYMDSQQQEIQKLLQGTDIEVQRTAENTLSIIMPSSITFAHNSATLTPQAKTAMNSVARVLNRYPDSKVTITGYTDDIGSDSFNIKLSEQRAVSVSNYLSSHNVSFTRLTQLGKGEAMPKLPNINETNRAQNRRVELAIVANQNARTQQGTVPQQLGDPQQQDDLFQQGYPQPQY